MANTFLTTDLIAPETLPSLIDNLVMPNLMYKDYANVFANEGDQIRVERPVVFIADEFGGTINLQDINEKYVFVTMDKIADVSMEITQSDLALSAEDFATKYSQPAAEAIAEKINDDGLDVYKYVYSFEGTSGTTPDALADLANARKRLNINKVPLMNRNAVWDPEADAKFSTLDAIAGLDKSGSTQALREGAIGRVSGLDNYMS